MITNHHRAELQERVRRGIALLDRECPEWRDKIRIERLDLSNSCQCILGQVYNYFDQGIEAIGLVSLLDDEDDGHYTLEEEIALTSHGFYGPLYEYGELTEVWKGELKGEPCII